MTTASTHRRLACLLAPAAAFTLGGCGINPLVKWQPQAEQDRRLDTMATARSDAASLRRALHDKAARKNNVPF